MGKKGMEVHRRDENPVKGLRSALLSRLVKLVRLVEAGQAGQAGRAGRCCKKKASQFLTTNRRNSMWHKGITARGIQEARDGMDNWKGEGWHG
jgi:hypothetical protein